MFADLIKAISTLLELIKSFSSAIAAWWHNKSIADQIKKEAEYDQRLREAQAGQEAQKVNAEFSDKLLQNEELSEEGKLEALRVRLRKPSI